MTSKNVTKCGDLTVSVDGNFEIKSEGTSGLARCVCISSRRCHDHDRGRQSVTSPRADQSAVSPSSSSSSWWSDDAGQGAGVRIPQRGEDDHLVRGTVGDGELVTQPPKES